MLASCGWADTVPSSRPASDNSHDFSLLREELVYSVGESKKVSSAETRVVPSEDDQVGRVDELVIVITCKLCPLPASRLVLGPKPRF